MQDREYYREVWGFDPVTDFKELPREYQNEDIHGYEALFPLIRDPGLHAAGLTISAMVAINDEGQPRNYIVFMKGKNLRRIYCVRTVIYHGPAEIVLSKEQKDLASLDLSGTVSLPALPPWEHFAALKSFVAGVAELGIENMLTYTHSVDDDMRSPHKFGLNDELQKQMLGALLSLAPKATRGLIRDWIMQLVDSAPPEWILQRRDELLHFMEDDSRDIRTSLLEIVDDILNNSPHEWLREHEVVLRGLFKDFYISPSEREISITKWGFDPWEDRVVPQKKDRWLKGIYDSPLYADDANFYYYIQKTPLRDLDVQGLQITLCGRVDAYPEGGSGFIYIGFEHLGEKRIVQCYSIYDEHFLEENINQIRQSIGNPSNSPPWVYAAALSKYLQHVSEQGIVSLFPSLQASTDFVAGFETSEGRNKATSSIRYREQIELFDILYYYARDQAYIVEIQFLMRLIEGKTNGKDAFLYEGGFFERFLTDDSTLLRLVAFAKPDWCLAHINQLRTLFVRPDSKVSKVYNQKNKRILDKIEKVSE